MSVAEVQEYRPQQPNSLLFFAPNSLASSRPTSPNFSHGRSISSPPTLPPSPVPRSPLPVSEQNALDHGEHDEQPVRISTTPHRPMSLTYGVSAVGRGFMNDWRWSGSSNNSPSGSSSASDPIPEASSAGDEERVDAPQEVQEEEVQSPSWSLGFTVKGGIFAPRPKSVSPPPVAAPPEDVPPVVTDEPESFGDLDSTPTAGGIPFPQSTDSASEASQSNPQSRDGSRPASPRARRRDSQKRISLVAGRLSMVSFHPPPSPPKTPHSDLTPSLSRFPSGLSIVSVAPPTPPATVTTSTSAVGGRSIDQFVIEGEAGRGAYGVVKRVRERLPDGTLGPSVILKQVVKSRILADCWKKHPRLGTIPIEIYVMSAISHTQYTLPYPRRPWDPQRAFVTGVEPAPRTEGEVVIGHPNICGLIEFWEDAHFYYLILPNAHPNRPADKSAPGDLFDLVELYPNGLPPSLIRSYLGQIADATSFLHSKGIVHRDIKDENVVLSEPDGACVLIDFGSSGVVRRAGWDTFSGTLDYAAPEILEGARYMGKEQDVWAFGVVAFVLLVGECPFASKAEAHFGLGPEPQQEGEGEDATGAFFDHPATSAPTKAGRALAGRTFGHDVNDHDRAFAGLEPDGGGALGDAATLVRACLQVDPALRPTFDDILRSRFLAGRSGWGSEWYPGWLADHPVPESTPPETDGEKLSP